MKNYRTILSLIVCAGLGSAVIAQGKPIIFDQHADINAFYNGSTWQVTLHDWDWGLYRDPSKTWVFCGPAARATWPSGSQWSFFSNPGAGVWVMPQGSKPKVPYFGVATDLMPGNYFDSYFNNDPRINRQGRFIKYSLVSVQGPGQFAVWQVDGFGSPTAWMTTKDGIGASDCLFNLEGGHTHFNWGFSDAGVYKIGFQVSAFKNGNLVSSPTTFVTFGVERLPVALPHP